MNRSARTSFIRRLLMAALAAAATCTATAADAPPLQPLLQPFAAGPGAPAAPWHVVGLPNQTKPFTRFAVVDIDGKTALRVEAESSYGNLVHPLNLPAAHQHLSWRWRVDQQLEAADLTIKSGDDTALKVCVSFDLPLERVPFVERTILRAARLNSIEPIPSATVCYVWDAHLPQGRDIDSAFTHRLRYKVLESGPAKLHQWANEKRDVSADFIELFGNESQEVPAIVAVLVGADADNTHGHSLGHVSDLVLEP